MVLLTTLLLGLTLAALLGALFGWISFFKISNLQKQIRDLRLELRSQATALKVDSQETENSAEPETNQQTPLPAWSFSTHTAGTETQNTEPNPEPPKTEVSLGASEFPDEKTAPLILRITQHLKGFWMIWVGGISIALSGVFLVKYSIESGLLNPQARILLALAFGVGLHIAAEWLRRKNKGADPVFAALAGGASITLYAAFFAALELYQLMSPTIAFVAMAAVALTTIMLAVVHGPVLAIMGLLGGYAVPILVSEGGGNIVAAMVYALIISFSALILMRRLFRLWLWFGMLAGTLLWWFLSLFDPSADAFRGWYLAIFSYGFLSIPTGDYLLKGGRSDSASVGEAQSTSKNLQDPVIISLIAVLGSCAVSLFFEGIGSNSIFQWLSLTTIVLLAVSQQPRLWYFSWCLLGLQLLALLANALSPLYLGQFELVVADPALESTVFGFAALMSLSYCLAAYHAIKLGNKLPSWYSLGFMSPILWLAFCYLQTTQMSVIWEWGLISALLGLSYLLVASKRFLKSEGDVAAIWLVFSGHAALSLGLVVCFREASLTLGIGLQLLSLAWLIKRYQLEGLDWLVKLVLSIIIVRLTLNPWLMTYPPDTHWSLWTYGGCTLLTALACIYLRQNDFLKGWLEAATIHLLVLTVAMETRYWLYDGEIFRGNYDLLEASINSLFLGAISLCYVYRAKHSENLRHWYQVMAELLLGLAMVNYILALTVLNPILGADPVSETPIFNLLIPAYGLPPIIALLVVKFHDSKFCKPAAWIAGIGTFAFVSMEIRHLWQGDLDLANPTISGELYTYSVAWLSAAIALVLYSSAKAKKALYQPSMAFLGIVIAKIFLVDMSDLEGLLRVASFMGLGLALLGLAFLHRSTSLGKSSSADAQA